MDFPVSFLFADSKLSKDSNLISFSLAGQWISSFVIAGKKSMDVLHPFFTQAANLDHNFRNFKLLEMKANHCITLQNGVLDYVSSH